jgi:hypothetical protein
MDYLSFSRYLWHETGHTDKLWHETGHTDKLWHDTGHTDKLWHDTGHTDKLWHDTGHTDKLWHDTGHTDKQFKINHLQLIKTRTTSIKTNYFKFVTTKINKIRYFLQIT